MDTLFEDGLGLDGLELGLEVFQASSIAAAVGATACVVQVEAFILNLFSIDAP